LGQSYDWSSGASTNQRRDCCESFAIAAASATRRRARARKRRRC